MFEGILLRTTTIALLLSWGGMLSAGDRAPATVSGTVTDADGQAIPGAMVTAFDSKTESSVSVFAQADGRFVIRNATAGTDRVRARLIGRLDNEIELDTEKSADDVQIVMETAGADELKMQMRGVDRLDLLKFDDEKDALNFKMMCAYCHQVGTEGFRTPEEPIDWQVMLTRMDGFGGLYEHTQKNIVDKIIETYGPGAEQKWPAFQPPAAPSGEALDAVIYEWDMGTQDKCMIHDLEPGNDGLIYVVDMANDCVRTLDPRTAERAVYAIPGGKEPDSDEHSVLGPHSIEPTENGDMWMTLAYSGQMARFVPASQEFTLFSGAPKPARRGRYPHSLRTDQLGIVWYTDAGTNSVFSIDPTSADVKEYRLLEAGQARGAGRGESRGITPYGISIAPDGKVWYSKLNGQRIGRIDPHAPDGSNRQIMEWQPPVHGPRRLHVAPDGIVWVPGWASGDFASFDPTTEKWQVYDLPAGPNSLPYALNIHPTTGDVWICGTGWDTIIRFTPATEQMTVYPMPSRVTYTREVEFDADGDVWLCNSNWPPRHTERHRGSLIKIVVPGNDSGRLAAAQ